MRTLSLYTEDSELDFGKYKGKKLAELIGVNDNYIRWCVDNIDWFCIPDEVFTKFKYVHISIVLNDKDCPKDEIQVKNSQKLVRLQKMIEEAEKEDENFYRRRDYYDDNSYSSSDWLADAAGCSDPEVMNDVYWNLD